MNPPSSIQTITNQTLRSRAKQRLLKLLEPLKANSTSKPSLLPSALRSRRASIYLNQLHRTFRLRANNDDRFPYNLSANDITHDPTWVAHRCRHRDAAADAAGHGASFSKDRGVLR